MDKYTQKLAKQFINLKINLALAGYSGKGKSKAIRDAEAFINAMSPTSRFDFPGIESALYSLDNMSAYGEFWRAVKAIEAVMIVQR